VRFRVISWFRFKLPTLPIALASGPRSLFDLRALAQQPRAGAHDPNLPTDLQLKPEAIERLFSSRQPPTNSPRSGQKHKATGANPWIDEIQTTASPCTGRQPAHSQLRANLARVMFNSVRSILLVLLVLATLSTYLLAQQAPTPKYYNYRITGTVKDELGRPAAAINICWMPSERAMAGRIPCTKTDETGHYSLTAIDIPDKYLILAASYAGLLIYGDGKSPATEPVYKNGKTEIKEIREYRDAGSGDLIFGAADESRTIDLQLTLHRWSDTDKRYETVQSKSTEPTPR